MDEEESGQAQTWRAKRTDLRHQCFTLSLWLSCICTLLHEILKTFPPKLSNNLCYAKITSLLNKFQFIQNRREDIEYFFGTHTHIKRIPSYNEPVFSIKICAQETLTRKQCALKSSGNLEQSQ